MYLRRKAAVYTVLTLVALAASVAFGYQLPQPATTKSVSPRLPVGNGSTLAALAGSFTGKPLGTGSQLCPFPGYTGRLYVQTPPPASSPGGWFAIVCVRDRSALPAG